MGMKAAEIEKLIKPKQAQTKEKAPEKSRPRAARGTST